MMGSLTVNDYSSEEVLERGMIPSGKCFEGNGPQGGVLSYEGVEVLRMVEGAQKHSHDMIIPSKMSLQHCASNGGTLR
jgi:hypothetical protein